MVHVFESTTAGVPLCQTLENHSSSVTAVKFGVDGRFLLSCGGDKALVLSSVNGRDVCRNKAVAVPYGTIYDLDVDATNKYMVTSGQDKRVNIWQVGEGGLRDGDDVYVLMPPSHHINMSVVPMLSVCYLLLTGEDREACEELQTRWPHR